MYLLGKYGTMNFGVFFNETLGPLGFDVVRNRYHAYHGAYDSELGWTLKLDSVDFGPKTLPVVHLPDFVTFRQDRILELERVERFYGDNSDRVLVTHWTSDLEKFYHGPLNLIKFSNHNYDLCHALLQSFDQWSHILNQPRSGWQCLNGRITPARRRAAYMMAKMGDARGLSLGTEIPLSQWNYSNYFGCENIDNFFRLLWLYARRAVNVVTETEYESPTGIITEKTLLAIAAEQIPVIIGHPGIADQCRAMGFDMFEDVVDLSYQWLPDQERVEQAILRNQDLILGRVDIAALRPRLQRNRQYLLTEFAARMEHDFAAAARQLANRLLPGYAT